VRGSQWTTNAGRRPGSTTGRTSCWCSTAPSLLSGSSELLLASVGACSKVEDPFKQSYAEVLLFLKHQDDKINRVLTALAFLTAAGVTLYIFGRSIPRHHQVSALRKLRHHCGRLFLWGSSDRSLLCRGYLVGCLGSNLVRSVFEIEAGTSYLQGATHSTSGLRGRLCLGSCCHCGFRAFDLKLRVSRRRFVFKRAGIATPRFA
jgi:hypothetical protein